MINMKIELINDKIIIYLYKYQLSFDSTVKLNDEIKSLFIKLIKVYHLDFFGYSKVHIYENKKYGSILEIEKIYNSEFNIEIIDLKLLVHRNTLFYLVFDDYYEFLKDKQMVIKNNKYYVDINLFDNILKYIEYGGIIYLKKEVLNN